MKHKLQLKREEYGLTIKDLAILSDISSSAISRIESQNNPYKTNDGVAKALANALDCSVEEIFSPLELSHLGRPAHTGKPLVYDQNTYMGEMSCIKCHIIAPAHIGCDDCDISAAA